MSLKKKFRKLKVTCNSFIYIFFKNFEFYRCVRYGGFNSLMMQTLNVNVDLNFQTPDLIMTDS